MNERFKYSITVAVKTVMLLHALLTTIFAVLSGANQAGLWANAVNAVPWLIALVLSLLAWHRPRLSGMGLLLWALGAAVFFSAWNHPFVLILFIFPPAILGWMIWRSATEL